MARLMRAVILKESGPCLQKIPVPKTDSHNDTLVRIETAAFNRRDYWITKGMYPRITFGGVMGSDACGTVVEPSTSPLLHRRVLINPTIGWEDRVDRGSGHLFDIMGMANGGTFADYVAVPSSRVVACPEHLSAEQAAAIPLAGVTAYRAVATRGAVKAGQTVLVTGAGSGVGSFAVQFAHALGAQVYVTSSSKDKIARAKQLGAKDGFLYTSDSWVKDVSKALPNGFDVVVDGGGGKDFGKLLRVVRMGGKVVVYGATAGPVQNLDLPHLFLKQIDILGTSMGSAEEFGEMVDLVAKHRIVPAVEAVEELEQFQAHFDRLHVSDGFGKLVLRVAAPARL